MHTSQCIAHLDELIRHLQAIRNAGVEWAGVPWSVLGLKRLDKVEVDVVWVNDDEQIVASGDTAANYQPREGEYRMVRLS